MKRHHMYILLITGLAVLLTAGSSQAIQKCTICHGKPDITRTEATGRTVSLHVTDSMLDASVHAGNECTDCHVDVVAIPHKEVAKVDCRRCHYSGNPVGAPSGELYDQYEHSVHGREVAAGNPDAPVCQDCHGSHEILFHEDIESSVFKANRPKTCGECHIDIYADYSQSIHGQALAEGILDSPDCVSCHGEHSIMRAGETALAGGALVKTCASCHDAMGVASRYGIESDRVATFEHSFHGVATVMGNRTVANCASCHGYHQILPEDNPQSMIHPDNIVQTCGKAECHPEATARFAKGQIHIDPYSKDSGILYYITKFFTILTVSTLAGLFIMIVLDLFRRAKTARAKREKAS